MLHKWTLKIKASFCSVVLPWIQQTVQMLPLKIYLLLHFDYFTPSIIFLQIKLKIVQNVFLYTYKNRNNY